MVGYDEAIRVVDRLLGIVQELPLIFESRLLCPCCLGIGSLVIAGGRYKCSLCGFGCKGVVRLTEQGRNWLMLTDSLKK